MFEVTIVGPIRVDCPLLEAMAATVEATAASVTELHLKVDQLLAGEGTGQPRIEFTIGPVREKE